MVNCQADIAMLNSATEKAISIDEVFAALAHSIRRSILLQLRHGSATVSELAQQFTVSPPAISKHLRVLEKAGLLVQKREGRMRRCYLVVDPLAEATEWLEQYRLFWEGNFDSLEAFLAEQEEENQ